ncbi:MAG: N-6 DNA methylase [Bacillota bacterium]|nr:N-6 DNA methylase [Bacillota bacterium]
MPLLNWNEIESRAVHFIAKWRNDPYGERQRAQGFIIDFLHVFGVDWMAGSHEFCVYDREGRRLYVDYLLPGQIVIEMKSRGESLINAYNQAYNYVRNLKPEEQPKLLMVCDFDWIEVTNLRTMHHYRRFRVSQLRRYLSMFGILAGYESSETFETHVDVNTEASYKLARVHDILKELGYEEHDIGIYLVRLLFCYFAEDTGIFEARSFERLLQNSKPDGSDLAERLSTLFYVLNTRENMRPQNLPEEYRHFRYINGDIFNQPVSPIWFTPQIREALIDCCAFDWSSISPAIFGAMFQGVMDPERRRELGAHYTSTENIMRVIEPLFLNQLWDEFERAKATKKELQDFHFKLASLTWLDPACGCGNFLIITYQQIRSLEFELLRLLYDSSQSGIIEAFSRISIEQFYGMEIEEFPTQIAQIGMILMKHLMDLELSNHFGFNLIDFPIRQSAHIICTNSLRFDWQDLVPKEKLSYIIGNPPFNGARTMSAAQKADLQNVFGRIRGVGNLDFVTAWYRKAADMMTGSDIRAAFVSTNSITQGEQPAILWQPLLNRAFEIIYAYRTFKWTNEARGQAAVHCVILGFAWRPVAVRKRIYETTDSLQDDVIFARNISPYLIDGPDIVVSNRSQPLCDVPELGVGNQPIDGGNYLFTAEEMQDFIAQEPAAESYFRPWYGAQEFINRQPRYCLYLAHVPPSQLRRMPRSMERIEAVRQFRLASSRRVTRQLAERPRKFAFTNIPASEFLLIPETSSERRYYVPIGFMSPDVLASSLVRIVPNATLYHFGVLTSAIHMSWMRLVAGRLEMRYRYSVELVYNNFPWPDASEAEIERIEGTALKILEVRERYPDESFADLYDPTVMPYDLLEAHHANDAAVQRAYGDALRDADGEEQIAIALLHLYDSLQGR